MRLSLMKAAHEDVGGAPWQEIRVARRFRPHVRPTASWGRSGEPGAPVPFPLDVVFSAEEVDEQGHHEEDGDDGGEHASYDDAG